MLTNEQEEILAEIIAERFTKINLKTLELIGNRISEINDLTATNKAQLKKMINVTGDIKLIETWLTKELNATAQEVEKVITEIAKANYTQASSSYIDKKQIPFKENAALQKIVKILTKETLGTLKNYSNTTLVGIIGIDGKYINFKDGYRALIDKAIEIKLSTGIDYTSQVRGVLNKIANGMVIYESGATRRVDTAVRYNILNTSHKMNQASQDLIGEEIGADGKEISMHANCADDHQHIQGLQVSNKEFEKINGKLSRKIGEHNCRHFVFSVRLGISKPINTKAKIKEINRKANKKITIDGVKKRRVEWQQEQNKAGLKIRRTKEKIALFDKAKDKEQVQKLKQRLKAEKHVYNTITEKAGLPKKAWQTRGHI